MAEQSEENTVSKRQAGWSPKRKRNLEGAVDGVADLVHKLTGQGRLADADTAERGLKRQIEEAAEEEGTLPNSTPQVGQTEESK